MSASGRLLERIEAYYDRAPRPSATVHEIGPFTLFVGTGAWKFYARPGLGADHREISGSDVAAVVERQRALGVPVEFEWVDEISPGLASTAAAAGLVVHRYPLLALDAPLQVDPVPGITVAVASAAAPDLAAADAAIGLGFAAGGTSAGEVGIAERDARVAEGERPAVGFLRQQIMAGHSVAVIARSADGPVGGGSANPRGDVAELTGIATLPAERRRGIGVAITAALAAEVRRAGVDVCFLGAASEDVARIYERAGFRRLATACAAEAPEA